MVLQIWKITGSGNGLLHQSLAEDREVKEPKFICAFPPHVARPPRDGREFAKQPQ